MGWSVMAAGAASRGWMQWDPAGVCRAPGKSRSAGGAPQCMLGAAPCPPPRRSITACRVSTLLPGPSARRDQAVAGAAWSSGIIPTPVLCRQGLAAGTAAEELSSTNIHWVVQGLPPHHWQLLSLLPLRQIRHQPLRQGETKSTSRRPRGTSCPASPGHVGPGRDVLHVPGMHSKALRASMIGQAGSPQ